MLSVSRGCYLFKVLFYDLSSFLQVLVVRNYGAICVGETIEETTYLAHLLVTACNQQVLYSLSNNCGVEKSSWWLFECHYNALLLSTPVRLSLIETFRVKEKTSWLRVFFFFFTYSQKVHTPQSFILFFCLFVFVLFFPIEKGLKGRSQEKKGPEQGVQSMGCGRLEVWIPPTLPTKYLVHSLFPPNVLQLAIRYNT